MILQVKGLTKSYGSGPTTHLAIDNVDFNVNDGEFVCIVGPSGAGKTTLLRCLSGLLAPSGGTVVLTGTEVVRPPSGLAFVFQDYNRSLLPWMTVSQNVSFPLRFKKETSKQEQRRLTDEALDAVGLTGTGDKYAWQLSGGMQQRVAIARAIAYQPRILLMDESFASVDAQTRADLEDLILDLRAKLNLTVLLVTHDIDEAVYLADRVIALSEAPCHVAAEFDVAFDEPRDQIRTKSDPHFAELRAEILGVVRHRVVDLSVVGRGLAL